MSKKQTTQRPEINKEAPTQLPNVDFNKNLHLDALRGLLAIIIVLLHVEIYQYYFDRPSAHFSFVVYSGGQIAITGFFVLSGYFITLGILKAKANNTFSVSAFYKRRIFRILPLYYILILACIFVFPNIDLLHFQFPTEGGFTHINDTPFGYWYYLLFMPQVALFNHEVLPFAEPTWSVGVEELFYLVIPLVFIKIKKSVTGVLVVFIIVINIIKSYQIYVNPPGEYMLLLNYYMYDCIALGCLVAIMHVNNSKLFRSINKTWHVALMLIVFAALFSTVTFRPINYLPYALCFAIFIAYFVNNNSKLKSPSWLVYIGKISYSLYLGHESMIILFLNLELDKSHALVMHLASLASSIALASVLYYTIEKPFMKYGASFNLNKDATSAKDNILLNSKK